MICVCLFVPKCTFRMQACHQFPSHLLSCPKTLDLVHSKQMLEKQLQARACSPHLKSSLPSMSPTRAPVGPSTLSAQPLQKPAQAKRVVRGKLSTLSTTRAAAVISATDVVHVDWTSHLPPPPPLLVLIKPFVL